MGLGFFLSAIISLEGGGVLKGSLGRGAVPLIRSSNPDPVKTKIVHYPMLFKTRDLINFYDPVPFYFRLLIANFHTLLKNSVPKGHLVQDAKE